VPFQTFSAPSGRSAQSARRSPHPRLPEAASVAPSEAVERVNARQDSMVAVEAAAQRVSLDATRRQLGRLPAGSVERNWIGWRGCCIAVSSVAAD